MRKLFTILSLFLFADAFSQNNVYYFNAADGTAKMRYDTTINGWNARIMRKVHITDSVELLGDVPGLGEVGTDTAKLNDNGYGYWISNGRWDGMVIYDSKNYHPVIAVLQPTAAWPSETTTDSRIDAVINRWPIKKRAVHVSGLSMGGWTFTTYVTGDAGSPYTRAFKITSVVESGGAKPDDNSPYPNKFDNFSTYGARGTGGKLLCFEQRLDDSRDGLTRVNRMNTIESGSYYIETTFGSEGHSNFNDHYNPNTTNWTTSNSEVSSTTPGGISLSMAQWQIAQGDTTTYGWSGGGGGGSTIVANAGTDTWVALDQHAASRTFNLSGTSSSSVGTVTYLWEALAGNPMATTITSSTDSATTVTGATVEGYYGYKFTTTDDNGSDADTVYIQVRDLMKKNVTPCRSGGGLKFTVTTSISGVSTTDVYLQYINRDLKFGELIQGGDTIVVPRNPNNGGKWNGIELGDFGGNFGCPVTIMSDSVTTIGASSGYFRIGNADSNVVTHTRIDGLANRETKGVVYGFQWDRNDAANEENTIGLTANLIHHFEIGGYSMKNCGVGIFIKKNSDSTKPFGIYDNFRMHRINLHDLYLFRINGEGFYVGHTDIAGNLQEGNSGRTIIGDSLTMRRIIIDSTNWDGLQVSNFGEDCQVDSIVTNRTGRANIGGQQWSVFVGGNTQATMHDIVSVNATGPIGTLGKGYIEIYNCIADSVDNGGSDADAMYVNMSLSGVLSPYDSLRVNAHSNYVARFNRHPIFYANTSGAMKVNSSSIVNNVRGTNLGSFSSNVTGTTISGNTTNTSYDIAANWGSNKTYQMYQLLRSSAPGALISFYDDTTPGGGGGEEPSPNGRRRIRKSLKTIKYKSF